MVVSNALEGIQMAERLHARNAPYDEVMEVLAAAERAPDAAEHLFAIISTQLTTMTLHSRGDDDVDSALQRYLAVADQEYYSLRLWKVIASCAHRPRLVAKYLPTLIREMEAQPEDAGRALPCARDWCARYGVDL